jgi:hypothetical protein
MYKNLISMHGVIASEKRTQVNNNNVFINNRFTQVNFEY